MVDFTREDCQYDLNGDRWTVNYNLAVHRGLDAERIESIKRLHQARARINSLAKVEPINSELTNAYRNMLSILERLLQDLWGFPQDDRFHPHQRIGV